MNGRGWSQKADSPDAARKVELLTSENERLKGQVGRLEERIAVLERIATDPAERTAREIEQLTLGKDERRGKSIGRRMARLIAMMALGIGMIGVIGWVFTTWLRIKHGYPLDGAWGQAVYPKSNDEAMERIKLLSQENAQLRAELGAVKDRLANVERIVTDDSHRLTQEIEALRVPRN